LQGSDLEGLSTLLNRLANLFGKKFGVYNDLEEITNNLEKLVDYIEKYMNDQKANNAEMQHLVDAQLEELSKAYEGLSSLFELNKVISSVNEPWMILKNVLKLLDNAINYSCAVVELDIDGKIYREIVGDEDKAGYLSQQAKDKLETVLLNVI